MNTGRARHTGLRTLFGTWLLANTAVWSFTLALGVHAYVVAGPGAVGLVAAARLLPGALAAPLAGRLVDRADRSRLAALAAGGQATCLGLIAGAIALEAPLALIAVLAAAWSCGLRVLRPALQAMLPTLAQSTRELARASAHWSATDSSGFLLAMAGAGAGLAAYGPAPVVAVAAVLSGIAGACALRLPAVPPIPPEETAEPESPLAAALGGLRAIRTERALRAPLGMLTALLLLEGTSEVQLVVLAIDDLGMGEGGPGLLNVGFGVGGLIASVLLLVLLRRRGYGLALLVGALVFAAGLVLVGRGGAAVAIAALVPMGIGFSLVQTGAMAVVPRLADDAVMGRVYALFEVLNAGAAGVGSLLAPLLVELLGARNGLAVTGVGFALATMLARRSLANLDAGQEQADRIRALLRGLPATAPLPLPMLERLVRGVRPVSARRGEVLMTAGEPGEDFMIIESGHVEIVEYQRVIGPGDGFGEIALLRDVPRTATVRALDDVHLWALGRRTFLAAVTGWPDARRAADDVVEGYLQRPASS